MTFRVLVVCAATALAVSACASVATQSGDVAATPEQAALAYDKSVRTTDRSIDSDFGCADADFTSGVYIPLDGTPITKSVRTVRAGNRWHVTVTVKDDVGSEYASSVYEVRRRDGGYCVSDQLPDPDSPRSRPS